MCIPLARHLSSASTQWKRSTCGLSQRGIGPCTVSIRSCSSASIELPGYLADRSEHGVNKVDQFLEHIYGVCIILSC